MSKLSTMNAEAQSMSSLEIAELTGKQHKHVLSDVRNVMAELGLDSAEFSAQYKDASGKSNEMFSIPKRECLILVSGYSLKMRAAIIDRWQHLESQQSKSSLPQTYAHALLEAGRLALELEQSTAALAIAAPKAEFVDRYVESSGTSCVRDVSKLLGAKEKDFKEFLLDSGVMYRKQASSGKIGAMMPYAEHVAAGRFEVKAGESNDHAFVQARFTTAGVEWISAKWRRVKQALSDANA